MLLLRDKFLVAVDYSSMRDVFLSEPCTLLVADVQKAWLLLHEDAPYKEVAACNRVKPLDQLIEEG